MGATGPRIIRDIEPGPGSSEADDRTPVGIGVAMFAPFDSVRGRELWRTDGTHRLRPPGPTGRHAQDIALARRSEIRSRLPW